MNKSDKLMLKAFFVVESEEHINLSDSKKNEKGKQIKKINEEIEKYIESVHTKSIFYVFSCCSNKDFDKGIILRNYNNKSILTFTPEVKIIDICYCSSDYRISNYKNDNLSKVLKKHRCSCNTFVDLKKLSITK